MSIDIVNIHIVAAAVIGSFIAADPNGSYVVITLDDTKDIKVGDVLAGSFTDSDGLFKTVRNVTRREEVRICLESWDCTLDQAIKLILKFMESKPGVIIAGAKRLVSDANDVAGQLRNEIIRS